NPLTKALFYEPVMPIKRKQRGTKKARRQFKKEISAGGLVIDGSRILMIQVKNLAGKIVWTFPKGKLEPGESSKQAALREVKEETGWCCSIVRALGRTKYHYVRKGYLISKTVHWFLMKPDKKIGIFDPKEIRNTRWFTKKTARSKINYPSDKLILKMPFNKL